MPAQTRRVDMRGDDLYLEVDTNSSDLVVAVRGYNETGEPARCRLTVTTGPSAGRSTGYRAIPANLGARGNPVLNFAVPTTVAGRLALEWDAARERYTNLDKEIEWPYVP